MRQQLKRLENRAQRGDGRLTMESQLIAIVGAVLIAVVAFGIVISGIVRGKERKDAWNECDDPNVPDLRKYWCRNCKGHHGIYSVGQNEATRCNNCDHHDVHSVTPITLLQKFGYSLFTLVCLSLGIYTETLVVDYLPIPIAYVFYGMAVLCAFGFGYVYRTKSAARNEWLDWAKKRGYEENAKKN